MRQKPRPNSRIAYVPYAAGYPLQAIPAERRRKAAEGEARAAVQRIAVELRLQDAKRGAAK